MNDTLTPKDLAISTIGATQLPGSARSFPRVASPDESYLRRSFHIGSLSPTTIRVAHQPRVTGSSKPQRSLFAVDQTIARLDAQSNPISTDQATVAFQATIPANISLTEFRTMVSTLLGALLENDGALITSVYNGEY